MSYHVVSMGLRNRRVWRWWQGCHPLLAQIALGFGLLLTLCLSLGMFFAFSIAFSFVTSFSIMSSGTRDCHPSQELPE